MNILSRLTGKLDELRAAGTYKELRYLTSPMGPVATIEGVGEVLVFCANNYLGLANDPEVVEAGHAGLKKYGAGTAGVRFICGTMDCHREVEERLARFLGVESALTFTSCWNANEGLLPTLAEQGDAILSDELNHASIIDAGRLARQATRKVYKHSDLASLEAVLTETQDAAVRLVITDGVFSMEGDIAKLPEIVALCRRFDATLIVDDSHGLGVLGDGGRGVHEHYGLPARGPEGIDIITGTFGKSLGGGVGGFVAGPRAVTEYLIQRSRPHLFSNALPPAMACTASKAIEILERGPERVTRLRSNVDRMRTGLRNLGYEVLESPTAILPIIVGDTAKAIRYSNRLLQMGVFVIGFGFPVVPEGHARLRVQMSAAHTAEHIDRALEAFRKLKEQE